MAVSGLCYMSVGLSVVALSRDLSFSTAFCGVIWTNLGKHLVQQNTSAVSHPPIGISGREDSSFLHLLPTHGQYYSVSY